MEKDKKGCGGDIELFYGDINYRVKCGEVNPVSKEVIFCKDCSKKSNQRQSKMNEDLKKLTNKELEERKDNLLIQKGISLAQKEEREFLNKLYNSSGLHIFQMIRERIAHLSTQSQEQGLKSRNSAPRSNEKSVYADNPTLDTRSQEEELKEAFKRLHLKCVEETKRLGMATYITHGKRCEALGRLEGFQGGISFAHNEELEFLKSDLIAFETHFNLMKQLKDIPEFLFISLENIIDELKERIFDLSRYSQQNKPTGMSLVGSADTISKEKRKWD